MVPCSEMGVFPVPRLADRHGFPGFLAAPLPMAQEMPHSGGERGQSRNHAMADDEDFAPRLGRQRASRGPKARRYVGRVVAAEIGRASWRARVWQYCEFSEGAVQFKKQRKV